MELLTMLGIKINNTKTLTGSKQNVLYPGHYVNLKEIIIQPIQQKSQHSMMMMKRHLAGRNMVPLVFNSVSVVGP